VARLGQLGLRLGLPLLGFLAWPVVHAQPPFAQTVLSAYRARRPLTPPHRTLAMPEANRVRRAFVVGLRSELGAPAGYKVALTSKVAQRRFGITHPVWGQLLEGMLLESGTTLPAHFGARPVFEGDLMVRLGGDRINEAETLPEALAAVDTVLPFLELPDLMYAPEVSPSAALLVAVNAGARYGIVGAPVRVAPTSEWAKRLGAIRLEIRDGGGAVLARGTSDALMGHPLNVLLWLRDALHRNGRRLHAGDLVSLGTITPPMPVPAQATLRARYHQLDPDGPREITVHFDAQRSKPQPAM